MSTTKLGKAYEKLVALVAEALYPGAEIKVGEWVTGPDGAREIDVSVRGLIEDHDIFILIECKDKKTDVGIGEIDALDSKRLDLGPIGRSSRATADSPVRLCEKLTAKA